MVMGVQLSLGGIVEGKCLHLLRLCMQLEHFAKKVADLSFWRPRARQGNCIGI